MTLRAALIPAALLAILGLGVWYSVVYLPGQDLRALDRNGVQTTAIVLTKKHLRGSVSEKRSAQYRMIVRFDRRDGRSQQTSHLVTRRFYESHDIGDQVAFRYVLDTPDIQQLDPNYRSDVRSDGRWLIALFAAIALYTLWDNGILRRKSANPDGK